MREQFMNCPKFEVDGEVSLELLLTERTHKHQECLGLLLFPCASGPSEAWTNGAPVLRLKRIVRNNSR